MIKSEPNLFHCLKTIFNNDNVPMASFHEFDRGIHTEAFNLPSLTIKSQQLVFWQGDMSFVNSISTYI